MTIIMFSTILVHPVDIKCGYNSDNILITEKNKRHFQKGKLKALLLYFNQKVR